LSWLRPQAYIPPATVPATRRLGCSLIISTLRQSSRPKCYCIPMRVISELVRYACSRPTAPANAIGLSQRCSSAFENVSRSRSTERQADLPSPLPLSTLSHHPLLL